MKISHDHQLIRGRRAGAYRAGYLVTGGTGLLGQHLVDELVTVLLEKKATYATPRGLLEPMLLLTPRLEPTIRASSVPRRHRSSDARAPLCTGPTRR